MAYQRKMLRRKDNSVMTFSGYAVVYYVNRYRIAPTVASTALDRFTRIVERNGGRIVSATPIKYQEVTN